MILHSEITASNDNLPAEEWRQVPSIPEIEASSHGRIRRKPHISIMPHGGTRTYESRPTFGEIRSSSKGARHLYFGTIYRGIGNVKVHFAVCEAFHGPNPDKEKGVRHLNENGLDNRPGNLIWASQKVNLNDPVFIKYLRRRVSPKARTNMTKQEKRAGIYDSILDVAQMRQTLYASRAAANDNDAESGLIDAEKA